MVAQIRNFVANLIFFMGGGRTNRVRTSRKLRVVFAVFRAPYAMLRAVLLIPKPLVFRQLTMVICTKCSLRCRDCANLISIYARSGNAYFVSFEKIEAVFAKLIAVVDYIFELQVIGGEPFLHEELGNILKFVSTTNKVGSIVVTTNGTVMPKSDLISVLSNPKLYVVVSDYGNISKKADEVVEFCDSNDINCIRVRLPFWHQNGSLEKRGRSLLLSKMVFLFCRNPECLTLLRGNLYHCPRQAHGVDLGLIPARDGDYVDIASTPERDLRVRLTNFRLKVSTIAACDHCDNARGIPMKKIEPAIQH